uniref:(northern house mosquito) hypothetical protein n=1 Tax=Culex pipiens TaxID=7175 RepID=A0A8D8G2A1_CULPI
MQTTSRALPLSLCRSSRRNKNKNKERCFNLWPQSLNSRRRGCGRRITRPAQITSVSFTSQRRRERIMEFGKKTGVVQTGGDVNAVLEFIGRSSCTQLGQRCIDELC